MNKIKILDLFAGCGGLMDGFEQTGLYETVATVEWEKAPCENLKKRLYSKWKYENADSIVFRFDIQRVNELINGWVNDPQYGSSQGLNQIVQEKNGIDIIIGGPPCQAYSLAGRIRDKNSMKFDYRNYLFESYLKLVEFYHPKLFVFENVPGILTAKPGEKKITDLIREQIEKIDYAIISDLKNTLVDFSEYKVPQKRTRVIILGINRNYYGEENTQKILENFYFKYLPRYKSSKKITVRDSIGDLPKLYPLAIPEKYNGKKISHSLPCPSVDNHIGRYHSNRDIKVFRILAKDIEEKTYNFKSIESIKKLYTEVTGKTSNIHKYHVIDWDSQSNLIPAHLYKDGLRHIHPDSTQARTITMREAARLQTFSDDYVFFGTNSEIFKMIGNAVPPEFAKYCALAIYDLMKDWEDK